MLAKRGTTGVLVFHLDELTCAVRADAVVEVVRAVAIRSVPGQPEFVAGVIDLRGTIVPVIDLRKRFGRPGKTLEPADNLIVVINRYRTVALWVGAMGDLVAFDPAALASPEGLVVGTRSLAGVYRAADGLVMLHDVDAFLSESEADALALVGTA